MAAGSPALAILLGMHAAPVRAQAAQAAASDHAQPALPSTVPAASATPAPPPASTQDSDDSEEDEITVTGRVQRGAVASEVPPTVTLNGATIRALGAANLDEVFEQLSPEIRSGRSEPGTQVGNPIVLVNGQRIADFASIRDFPPEAVSRIEVFPEKVALEYGYGADQRVVNVVLRSAYRALTLLGRYTAASDGGRDTYRAKTTLLRIRDDSYSALGFDFTHQGAAYAATTLAAPGATGPAPNHTLLAQDDRLTLNGVSTSTIGQTSAQFTARLDLDALQSRPGLSNEDGALLAEQGLTDLITGPYQRRDQSVTAHANATFDGKFDDWRWSFVGNLDQATHVIRTRVLDDDRGMPTVLLPSPGLLGERCRAGDGADDCVSTTTRIASADAFLNGDLFALPAGAVTTALRFGGLLTDLRSDPLLDPNHARLHRQQGSVSANVIFPLASRGSPIGKLSVGVNGGADFLSDRRTQPNVGGTLDWSPVAPVSFLATVSRQRQAPSLLQLGEARLLTPDLRQFDFANDTTTIVRLLTGGNIGLRDQTTSLATARLQVTPFSTTNLTLSGEYTREHVRNPIVVVSAATTATLAAFPERFTQSGAGYVTGVDLSPLNLDRRDRQQFRYGITYSALFGATPAPTARRQSRNQFQIALYDTWRLQDDVVLRSGGPRLDLLDHDIIGNGGGTPDHEIELQSSLATRAWSLNLTANWQTPTSAYAGALGTDKLTFTQGVTLGARLQIDLDEQHWLTRRFKFLRGNLNITAENLLGAHTRVRDASGAVPAAYTSDYLRPGGRTFRLTLRKRFR